LLIVVAFTDEVESLTAARAGAMAGTEPTDALRVRLVLSTDIPFSSILPQVVNALLTQLDKLRHKKNVLVVSTSNLAKAIGQYETFT
jgi:SpoVK/Ycf46/Vps4 family AAA+-type ATPase